jgi:coenzyme F420-0:L-glutamate ligase/coenzyme F420-1:gamma-L-glutamate ligase
MHLEVIPVRIRREIDSEDTVPALIKEAKAKLQDGDVLVVSQKIVSKIEGRIISLESVIPSMLSQGIASEYGKDPRLVEIILSESRRIVRMRDGVIITETAGGLICANAGVDESNVRPGMATLLPENPDRSARQIRSEIKRVLHRDVAVLISDTLGRPFRMGQTDVAIGVSGLQAILDYKGSRDSFGRELRVTAIAVADELCAAAELVMAKTEMCPAAVIRNYAFRRGESGEGLIRPEEQDLFR